MTRWKSFGAMMMIIGVLALGVAGSVRAQATGKTLTIYPLGDSITFGYTRAVGNHWFPGGYRAKLYKLLTKAGYTIHFVGSTTRNASPALLHAADAQHDGWPGWRIDQIASHIKKWLTIGGYRFKGPAYPDFILLHIGTNDIAQFYDPKYPHRNESQEQFMRDLEFRMTHLVREIVMVRPKSHLLVAQILPMGNSSPKFKSGSCNVAVREFNTFIKTTLVPEFQRKGDRVTLVDQYSNFSTPSGRPIWKNLLPDKVHPDPYGYNLMARTWFKAIMQILHKQAH